MNSGCGVRRGKADPALGLNSNPGYLKAGQTALHFRGRNLHCTLGALESWMCSQKLDKLYRTQWDGAVDQDRWCCGPTPHSVTEASLRTGFTLVNPPLLCFAASICPVPAGLEPLWSPWFCVHPAMVQELWVRQGSIAVLHPTQLLCLWAPQHLSAPTHRQGALLEFRNSAHQQHRTHLFHSLSIQLQLQSAEPWGKGDAALGLSAETAYRAPALILSAAPVIWIIAVFRTFPHRFFTVFMQKKDDLCTFRSHRFASCFCCSFQTMALISLLWNGTKRCFLIYLCSCFVRTRTFSYCMCMQCSTQQVADFLKQSTNCLVNLRSLLKPRNGKHFL